MPRERLIGDRDHLRRALSAALQTKQATVGNAFLLERLHVDINCCMMNGQVDVGEKLMAARNALMEAMNHGWPGIVNDDVEEMIEIIRAQMQQVQ